MNHLTVPFISYLRFLKKRVPSVYRTVLSCDARADIEIIFQYRKTNIALTIALKLDNVNLLTVKDLNFDIALDTGTGQIMQRDRADHAVSQYKSSLGTVQTKVEFALPDRFLG